MISTTFLFINALLMLCSVLAQDRSIRTADVSGVTFTLNASEICHDGSFIFFLQREQWNLARIELLGSLQSGFSGDDMEFYKRSFGIVEVALQDRQKNEPIQEQKPAAKGKAKPKPKANPKSTPKEGTASLSKSRSMLDSITYYRIFKNANDNIRSLLMQLAYELDNDSKGFHAQNCYKDECYHHRLSSKPAAAMKEHYVRATYSKRYPFTFVRDPIDRFISGMTEIEYRAQQVLKKSPNEFALPFQSPLGSQLRVNEFIRMILLSDASSILFRNQKLEIMHIVPMIGTFLLAQKVEGRPLKMFKLESFEQEWQSLANATKLTQLSNLYKSRSSKQWVVHPSSSDPYATTAAARNLFSFVSPQAFAR